MNRGGRPLRFLATIVLAWVGVRVVLLWPRTAAPPAMADSSPLSVQPQSRDAPAMAHVAIRSRAARHVVPGRAFPVAPAPRPSTLPFARAPVAEPPFASSLLHRPARVSSPAAPDVPRVAVAAPDRLTPLPERWSASAWFVLRAGRGIGAAPGGGQIGGGQAGMRLAYSLAQRQRVAAFARVAAPLRGKGREAAIGIEWQPTRAPIRLIAEQRFGLDGSPGGPGAGLVGGYDGTLGGFRLETYGQAGAILRDRVDPYADGAVRALRPLARRGPVSLALGLGAWGAAQRDAQRLDVGPSAAISAGPVRVSLDWRQRIAGAARPGSGLTLTIGSDF